MHPIMQGMLAILIIALAAGLSLTALAAAPGAGAFIGALVGGLVLLTLISLAGGGDG
jgi:hypothetical protein